MEHEERIKELLSVELLSEVLGFEIIKIEDIKQNKIYYISKTFLPGERINIDTFCFKCIDYCKENKVLLDIEQCIDEINDIYFSKVAFNLLKPPMIEKTHQEAIIKATNYIIKENQ